MSRFKEQAVVSSPCPTTSTSGVVEPNADEELELDRVPLPEAIGRVQRGEWKRPQIRPGDASCAVSIATVIGPRVCKHAD